MNLPKATSSLETVSLAIALAIGLAVGLQSVYKPVHIDDALYLHIAHQILKSPLDPFGGTINWQQNTQPAYKVSISPPLLSYQFAAVMAVCGESEAALHASMVPWAMLASWSIFRLGQRFSPWPLTCTLGVMLAPAVVVGLNLMLDVPLLACITTAMECGFRFADRRPWRWGILAIGFGGAAVLIKFAGLALAPLAVIAAVERRSFKLLVVATGPLAAYLAWQQFSRMTYGSAQSEQGLSFLERFKTDLLQMIAERTITMAVLLLMTLPAWIAAFAFMSRRRDGSPCPSTRNYPGRWTLICWVGGLSAFVILFGPFVAVRSFLPIHPPLVWLVARGVQHRDWGFPLMKLSVILAAILSSLLQWADWRWAAVYPRAIADIRRGLADHSGPVYFLGHWGWQYYAEKAGFIPWEAGELMPPIGAKMLIPTRPDRQMVYPPLRRFFRSTSVIEFPPHPLFLTTWNRARGIRFYGGDFGEIPWGFSREFTDRIAICEATSTPSQTEDPLLFPPETSGRGSRQIRDKSDGNATE